MFKCLLFELMMVLLPSAASAIPLQQRRVVEDTLAIRFCMDSIFVDMDYADNRASWMRFEQNFNQNFSSVSPHALQLDIYSGASPDGSAKHNRWLGANRGEAIRWLVREHLPGRVGRIIVHNEGARWEGLFEAVACSNEPWRKDVLRIISLPASEDETHRDHREYKLRALKGGTVWTVLKNKYLAPLRSSATAILTLHQGGQCDTLYIRDTVVIAPPVVVPQLMPATFAVDSVGMDVVPQQMDIETKPKLRLPVWGMRTNMLLLAMGGTPNLQLEWSLGHKDKWSVAVEGVCSWWIFARNAYANELIYGSVELRRWLGRRWRRHTLSGWHVGLGVGGGYGDIEWKSQGYQGELISGFLNIGYQARFGKRKRWSFDAGIGLGYVYAPYRRYNGSSITPTGREERYDNHLMWQETGRLNWIGTPHVNISLGYVFNQKDASWRRKKAVARDAARNAVMHHRDSLLLRERYQRDSLKVAEKLRLNEIKLLPKAERTKAMSELEAEQNLKKVSKRQARMDARHQAKLQKRQARHDARQAKMNARAERDSIRLLKLDAKEYWKQLPKAERRAIKQEVKAEKALARQQAKEARRQAKIERKQALKQAKADRKAARMRARIDAQQRRNLERLRFNMEKNNNKYNIK